MVTCPLVCESEQPGWHKGNRLDGVHRRDTPPGWGAQQGHAPRVGCKAGTRPQGGVHRRDMPPLACFQQCPPNVSSSVVKSLWILALPASSIVILNCKLIGLFKHTNVQFFQCYLRRRLLLFSPNMLLHKTIGVPFGCGAALCLDNRTVVTLETEGERNGSLREPAYH